jgi:exonuclease III
MKNISVNMRGLRGRAKKPSLKHMMDLDRSDIVFIQEMMGPCTHIISILVKLFSGYNFFGVDSIGFLGGGINYNLLF